MYIGALNGDNISLIVTIQLSNVLPLKHVASKQCVAFLCLFFYRMRAGEPHRALSSDEMRHIAISLLRKGV